MEKIKNCESCAFYSDLPGSPLCDGICSARKSKPALVRKWFTKCKFWTEKGEGNDPQG